MTPRYAIRGRSAAAIVQSVEDALRAGRLVPGAALPPVRRLATALSVSPTTVAAAYRSLRLRGVVAGAGRGGTHIRPAAPLSTARAVALAEGLVDLASGNPDPALLPPLATALRAVSPEPRLYGGGTEVKSLRRFVAVDLEADGVPARSLTLTNGALDAIERLLREHLRPGDAIAVEDPTLPGLIDLLAAAGYRAVPVALDAEGPLPDALNAAMRGAAAVILTSRAQNPTGAALTAGRVTELRKVLRRRSRALVIESDPCGPVAGVPCLPVIGAGTGARSSSERWAFIRSTSKFLGPDLRVAVVAGDERTIARVESRFGLGARWVSTLLQQLVVALWSDPASGRLLARAAEVYAQRQQALVTTLRARGIAAHGGSGFNVWVPVRHEGPVVAGLAEAGWGVAAGERFRLKAPPAIRITTACLRPADAERLAADLAALAPMDSARAAAC